MSQALLQNANLNNAMLDKAVLDQTDFKGASMNFTDFGTAFKTEAIFE